ncbi:hypothetical protein PR048_007471 [Dryococelus australis]|uniref:Uncharacterized protein n=1 Tax=Dryococelus australis TaxID=614101 RepID=A0ABQ9HUB7_9NEOP|nr:hypothetical protein PR048_007471 [Dryococelus australis]
MEEREISQEGDRPLHYCNEGEQIKFHINVGPTMTEWLDRSLPIKAIRVQSPAGSPDFRMYESAGRCRWSAGFLWDLQFPPPLHSGAAPFLPHFILVSSQYHWLGHSPPTWANRARFPSAGGLPFPKSFHPGAAPYSLRFTNIGSRGLDECGSAARLFLSLSLARSELLLRLRQGKTACACVCARAGLQFVGRQSRTGSSQWRRGCECVPTWGLTAPETAPYPPSSINAHRIHRVFAEFRVRAVVCLTNERLACHKRNETVVEPTSCVISCCYRSNVGDTELPGNIHHCLAIVVAMLTYDQT